MCMEQNSVFSKVVFKAQPAAGTDAKEPSTKSPLATDLPFQFIRPWGLDTVQMRAK